MLMWMGVSVASEDCQMLSRARRSERSVDTCCESERSVNESDAFTTPQVGAMGGTSVGSPENMQNKLRSSIVIQSIHAHLLMFTDPHKSDKIHTSTYSSPKNRVGDSFTTIP
jgi:hypothetical protein